MLKFEITGDFISNNIYFGFLTGKYGVRFIPRENGVHFVHVRLNGNHVPGSPFRVMVGRIDADVGMVRAYGDGLSRGNTGTFLREKICNIVLTLRQ